MFENSFQPIFPGILLKYNHFAGSANGRPRRSERWNLGPIPSPAALRQAQCFSTGIGKDEKLTLSEIEGNPCPAASWQLLHRPIELAQIIHHQFGDLV